MSSIGKRLVKWLVPAGLVVIGLVVGLLLPADKVKNKITAVIAKVSGRPALVDDGHDHHDHDEGGHAGHAGHDHDSHDHSFESDPGDEVDLAALDFEIPGFEGVEISEAVGDLHVLTLATDKALGLEWGTVEIKPFVQRHLVPAFVRERPAISGLQASSKLNGIVRKVYVEVGESVREGDPIAELELTGDALATSQSSLLESINQLKIVEEEIVRLESISSIAKKGLIEKRYEKKRIEAVIDARRQELLVRGLTEKQLEIIELTGKLIRTFVVHVPRGIRPEQPLEVTRIPDRENTTSSDSTVAQSVSLASAKTSDDWVYSIEQLHIAPGSVVTAGEALCDIGYHETLLLEGHAFERDLPLLTRMISDQSGVEIELGDDDNPIVLNDLPILYMDNHVDEKTQTFRFYVEMENELGGENRVRKGRRYRSWLFKPGQRGHIGLPSEIWNDKIVVPVEAVAEDGIENVVYRKHGVHDEPESGEPSHLDYEQINVTVLHRGKKFAVIETDGWLKPGDEIAMTNAYLLLLAIKQEDAGSDGGHSHAGHSH